MFESAATGRSFMYGFQSCGVLELAWTDAAVHRPKAPGTCAAPQLAVSLCLCLCHQGTFWVIIHAVGDLYAMTMWSQLTGRPFQGLVTKAPLHHAFSGCPMALEEDTED